MKIRFEIWIQVWEAKSKALKIYKSSRTTERSERVKNPDRAKSQMEQR